MTENNNQNSIKKIKSFIKNNIAWIIFAICIIIVIKILEDVFESEIMKCDTFAYALFINHLRIGWVTSIMKVITMFGTATVLLTITTLSLIFIKDKKIGLWMIVNLLGISALNVLLKNIVQRPRPIGYRLINESGYSFPSGHSMVSTAFYGLIIYFVFKNVKNRALRNTICILLGLLIILIGSSRIYLGVHYASDVIAGFLISIAYLVIITRLISKFTTK